MTAAGTREGAEGEGERRQPFQESISTLFTMDEPIIDIRYTLENEEEDAHRRHQPEVENWSKREGVVEEEVVQDT